MSNVICVICKIPLTEVDQYLFKCTNCKREYILEYEVMAYQDEIGTAYDEEAATLELEGLAGASGPRLETKKDELDFPSLDEQHKQEKESKDKIKIPKYMQDSVTTKVIDYREE